MTKLGQRLHRPMSLSLRPHRPRLSRKSALWLAGLALAVGSLTLAQAGQTKATPAVNGVDDTSVNVQASTVRAQSVSKPHTEVQVQSDNSDGDNSASEPNANTQVTVNGHSIEVPSNGSVHTTVPAENSNSSGVDVTINQSHDSSGDNSSSSSSSINVFSQSNSSINSEVSTNE